MNKKINYKKLFKRIMIIITMILILFFIVKKINEGKEKWVGIDSGYISISSQHRGLIVTDEIVYRTLSAGYLKNPKNEGERIKKSQLIADFVSTNDSQENLNQNTAIKNNDNRDSIKNTENVSIDINQVKLDADNLYQKLKICLINGENKKAKDTKRELAYTLEYLKKLESNIYTSQSVFNENEKLISSKNAEFEQIFNIVSSESGVVSYYVDDLTGKLKYKDRYKLNYENLFNSSHDAINKMNRKVFEDEILLKLIYKQKWHLLCECSLEDLDTYKIDTKIVINSKGEEFNAIIVDKFKSKDKGILCLEISEVSDILNKSRIIDVRMEIEKVAGVLIPKEAICNQNYIKGVYVKGLEDEKIFRPIQILGQKDEYTIVSEGSYTYKSENGNLKTVDTVNKNDKVLIKQE